MIPTPGLDDRFLRFFAKTAGLVGLVQGMGHKWDNRFRQGKNNGTRCHFRDANNARAVRSRNECTRIHNAQSEPARYGSCYTAVSQVQSSIFYCGPVCSYCTFKLPDTGILLVVGLSGNVVIFDETRIAVSVLAGVGQLRFISCQSAASLGKCSLERARIYFCQKISGMDTLAFGKVYSLQMAAYTACHEHIGERLDCAEPFEIVRDVLGQRLGCAHRCCASGGTMAGRAKKESKDKESGQDEQGKNEQIFSGYDAGHMQRFLAL